MKFKVKKAEMEDSNLVFRLTKRAFQHYNVPSRSPTTPALSETIEDVEEDIKEKNILIAYLNDKPVGSVRFYSSNGKDFYLSRLGVIGEYQNQGVGQRLVAEVERWAKAQGGERITLYSAYSSKKLMEFYQKLGYEIIEIRDDPDYTRAVIQKELDQVDAGKIKEEQDYEAMGW
ncbi:GNAT family N-acetyltransferase [Acetohalobium arabaticum]|uniref:GCN5-related N-acetyltransferase n=1 Tax=Acetohalobium arabaticum (strain ATCC 49924 / DSM 5501 / Z-7288) TaxID=574087 RepID=D9QR96_ACEAZ|nr:GNAT family N-acetyltransferase [Acetohalobium arabaticum]ADL13037.1 GCN5-related N-acetyltransferase [Acetohalobium arabaticum DSM 5501]